MDYLKKYPFSLFVIAIIIYLSLFRPPKTDLDEIPNIDKIAHICMYGGLGLMIWLEYFRSHISLNVRRLVLGAIIMPILFSGCMELIQEYGTTYRGGDWLDWLANTIGTFLAALIGYYIIKPIIEKHPQWKKKKKA